MLIFRAGGLLIVLYQLQPLFPVERELVIIRDKGDAITKGMGNNEVVAGVIMLLSHVYLQASILFVMLLVEI